eukprot:TRINITY_DN1856_c1_g1_i1.p1 TRINITY_DN1856_c1_g1~~TRINITY_DN1856_c1_g1_i1.p1  ORF type:complete len:179 (+),score=29.15 TRINITY_DN1856_c1_g1_i1:54-590(+)
MRRKEKKKKQKKNNSMAASHINTATGKPAAAHRPTTTRLPLENLAAYQECHLRPATEVGKARVPGPPRATDLEVFNLRRGAWRNLTEEAIKRRQDSTDRNHPPSRRRQYGKEPAASGVLPPSGGIATGQVTGRRHEDRLRSLQVRIGQEIDASRPPRMPKPSRQRSKEFSLLKIGYAR